MEAETRVTHTPGPWQLDSGDLGVVLDAEGLPIQTSGPHCIVGDGSYYANARLIAAAPDLLAAAQWAFAVIDPRSGQEASDLSAALRTALAKAEGRA